MDSHVFYRVTLFLFFKRKTAYEMRISDWSSDVCSSDLMAATSDPVPNHISLPDVPGWTRVDYRPSYPWKPHFAGADHELLGRYRNGGGLEADLAIDRKSVVSGKSVSVRVDLGGRRIIKKKNIHSHLNTSTM